MLLSTCPSINTKCVLRSNTIFGCWGEAKSKRLKECFGVDFGNLTKQIYLFDPKINGVFFRIQLTPHLAVKHLVCSILLLLVHFNPKKAFRKTTVEVDKVEKVDRFGVDIQNLAQKIAVAWSKCTRFVTLDFALIAGAICLGHSVRF